MTESAQGIVLLVSDVLANTPPERITEDGRDVLVRALRRSLHTDVSVSDERAVFEAVLNAGMSVTAPFNPEFASAAERASDEFHCPNCGHVHYCWSSADRSFSL